MTAPSERSLGRHVPPTLDDARLARQVAAVAARTDLRSRPRGTRRALTVAVRTTCVGAVALATIVGVMAVRSRWLGPLREESGAALSGTTFEAPAGGETITLGDGSRAVLEARSELTLVAVRPELVRVALERGGVDFDVTHADGKQFVVSARGYEIRVLGTRFNVRLGETEGTPALEVRVARGRVRVTREASDGQDERVLDAGETWSTARTTVPETRGAPPPAKVEAGESPRVLLARAEAFRAANDPRAAARLFDALRVRHHGDPRAGLAAFELGRLRLDRLDDPRGAAEALNDAIAVAPDAPFREDAQARLVEAYDASRDHSRCLEARAAYLSRYPRGVHRDKIAARCAE
jgi:ferric-dicitrate binding protein FerR (iron transport regulator)